MRPTTKVLLAGFVAALGLVASGSASGEISSFTVDSRATLSADRAGATVTGTITCTEGDAASVSVNIVQVVGRKLTTASGSTEISCTGAVQGWSAAAHTFGTTTLRLSPGAATVGASAFDSTDFTSTGGNHAIKLSPH